jgi:hypothetical protein
MEGARHNLPKPSQLPSWHALPLQTIRDSPPSNQEFQS